MGLESVLLCLDNSEYMLNGDYNPTRLHSQSEVSTYITNIKLNNNSETEVGLVTMSNKVNIVLTPTREIGKLMTAINNIKINGKVNFINTLKIAQLALKNRSNKSQRQRIIVFIASPLPHDIAEELIKVGKNFKKNSIAVDVINFGDEETINGNVDLLVSFINTVNNADNSKLVNVPPGPHNLSDMVASILQDGDAPVPSAASFGGQFNEDGIDANMDPELAMVLRASMEEENERLRQLAVNNSKGDAAATSSSNDVYMENEDEELAAAIAMSMQEDVEMTSAAPTESKSSVAVYF